jgi:hypothetical protein
MQVIRHEVAGKNSFDHGEPMQVCLCRGRVKDLQQRAVIGQQLTVHGRFDLPA